DVALDTSGATGAFADAHAGNGKAVTVSGLALTGADKDNYSVTDASGATANITPKPVTATGITASNKVYNTTTAAALNTGAAALTGGAAADGDNKYYTGDDVALDASGATGAFANAHAGDDKTVTITGLALTGADKDNYSVTGSTTADITAKPITAAGITANNKAYNGTTTATLNTGAATLTGGAAADGDNQYYTGDDVALDVSGATGAFADTAVESDKAVTVSGLSLTGADKDNYSVTDASGATADITATPLTTSGVTANKTYDGTILATVNIDSALLVGVADGDIVVLVLGTATGSFDTKDVGVGKTVTGLSPDLTLGGADADNYALTQPTITSADITAKALTVSGITANSKINDGTDTAVIDVLHALLEGVIGAEIVTLNTDNAVGAFADADVGTGKTVTVTGLAIEGADVGNYTLVAPTTTADITAVPPPPSTENLNEESNTQLSVIAVPRFLLPDLADFSTNQSNTFNSYMVFVYVYHGPVFSDATAFDMILANAGRLQLMNGVITLILD
ncbi:MAG: YDG domain-containing protein, partial [Candidatus Omnitrophota bacterium]